MRHWITQDTEADGGIDLFPLSQISQGVNFCRGLLLHVILNGVRDLAQAALSHNLACVIHQLSEILRFAQDDMH